MPCQTLSNSLICTFLYVSIIYTTIKTITLSTLSTTKANNEIVLCNETVVVYLDGMPVYTVIGEGCKSVAKLAKFYTIINNTVFFWHIANSTTAFFEEHRRNISFPYHLIAITILVLRKIFSSEAE